MKPKIVKELEEYKRKALSTNEGKQLKLPFDGKIERNYELCREEKCFGQGCPKCNYEGVVPKSAGS